MVFNRVETYTFQEFRNKDLIKEMNRLENILNHLKKHRRLYMKLTFIVSLMLISGYLNPLVSYAADVDRAIKRLDTLGNQLLKLVRVIAYCAVLITKSKDCIREALNGDKKVVGGVYAGISS